MDITTNTKQITYIYGSMPIHSAAYRQDISTSFYAPLVWWLREVTFVKGEDGVHRCDGSRPGTINFASILKHQKL